MVIYTHSKKGVCFILKVNKISIVQNESLYNFLLSSMYFNQARNEKEVFELWHYGENNCNIAKQLNVSEGTVRNRKKTLITKAKETLKNTYSVF